MGTYMLEEPCFPSIETHDFISKKTVHVTVMTDLICETLRITYKKE